MRFLLTLDEATLVLLIRLETFVFHHLLVVGRVIPIQLLLSLGGGFVLKDVIPEIKVVTEKPPVFLLAYRARIAIDLV